ncbi:hypothetical protein A3D78_04440 [Candidatus Gottesmanbacteria bacterium RIFCSPHIGHO2_02_FULL_39_14]|uniref:GIY-YIG domain-containing protein n=3 Tax=Candidatus Gottesmaniibacteriota TaxID=1752720 RepID=A0A1F6A4A0_9BACT|nr:MAG: hypothetical protein A2153_01370 [Candidatus Gottesmanbacteria bacterium RBG_16_38_7b]OGG19097.1 MAG: hypothetical protein A3D78_04440 [Candidatus Gottesmanbacteria bacterium RIFCSPHIGHO2_02_FULL_39_14]OGG30853.1 MAG: hypothetical protein A3I51_01470 [Candidatus Gottesmanbacteria bacterium RIFCSPLOWO2_02_FULL_38_8]
MWFVYILLCKDRSLYTGVSNNPQKRFSDHQTGKGSKYTRSFKAKSIVHLEKYMTKSEALKRERLIKSWSREKKIRILNLKI